MTDNIRFRLCVGSHMRSQLHQRTKIYIVNTHMHMEMDGSRIMRQCLTRHVLILRSTNVYWHFYHDDVIKWKHFPPYWTFVRGIHQSPVNSPHIGQCCGALVFSFICALNKRLSKHSWGWWFETPSYSLWCHCNDEFDDTENPGYLDPYGRQGTVQAKLTGPNQRKTE